MPKAQSKKAPVEEVVTDEATTEEAPVEEVVLNEDGFAPGEPVTFDDVMQAQRNKRQAKAEAE